MPGLVDLEVQELTVHSDTRGRLWEIFRRSLGQDPAQTLITTALGGAAKGGHYHCRKTEWFCALTGAGVLRLRDQATGAEQTLELSGGRPILVKVPPGVAHQVINTGVNEFLLLVAADEEYDPAEPDTYEG